MKGARPAHILMVHQGGVGDFVLCLPALGAIRRYYHEARIELMGFHRILQLVEGRHYVDKGTSIDRVGLESLYVENGKIDGAVLRYFAGFDLAFLFMRDREGIFSNNVARAGVREVLSISPFPEEGGRVHVVDRVLSRLSSKGVPQGGRIPKIFLLEEDRRFAKAWLSQRVGAEGLEKGLVAIHPGSGSRKNLWPFENFLTLAKRILHDLRLNTIILVGPAERESLGNGLERMRSMSSIWAENLPLIQVGSLLDRCGCYIGNDSGITHLAAAIGIPTIALFGPTDPEVWGPRGKKVVIVRKNLGCSPCTEEEVRRCSHRRCLELIEVEEVMERAKELMYEGAAERSE